MGLKEVINSPRGKMLIAVLLGFGLSTFFRKECKDKKCLEFKAPALDKINGEMFEYNTKCYEFKSVQQDCKRSKKKVHF
jgi:hypothetical protein